MSKERKSRVDGRIEVDSAKDFFSLVMTDLAQEREFLEKLFINLQGYHCRCLVGVIVKLNINLLEDHDLKLTPKASRQLNNLTQEQKHEFSRILRRLVMRH